MDDVVPLIELTELLQVNFIECDIREFDVANHTKSLGAGRMLHGDPSLLVHPEMR